MEWSGNDNKESQVVSKSKIDDMQSRGKRLRSHAMDSYFKSFIINPTSWIWFFTWRNDWKPLRLLRNGQIEVFRKMVKDIKWSKIETYRNIGQELDWLSNFAWHVMWRTSARTTVQQTQFIENIVKYTSPSLKEKIEKNKADITNSQWKSAIKGVLNWLLWVFWTKFKLLQSWVQAISWKLDSKEPDSVVNTRNHILHQWSAPAWSMLYSLISISLALDFWDDDENASQAIAFWFFRSLIPVLLAQLIVTFWSDLSKKWEWESNNPFADESEENNNSKPNNTKPNNPFII